MAEEFDIRARAKKLEATLHRLRARGASETERIDAVEAAVREAIVAHTGQLVRMIKRLCSLLWNLPARKGEINDATNAAYRVIGETVPK